MSTMFTTRHLKAGEELYAPGDDLDTLYIVAGGLVEETWKRAFVPQRRSPPVYPSTPAGAETCIFRSSGDNRLG